MNVLMSRPVKVVAIEDEVDCMSVSVIVRSSVVFTGSRYEWLLSGGVGCCGSIQWLVDNLGVVG